MKTDVNGCSSCLPGQEQYELLRSFGEVRVQYDYRTPSGELFSTVAPSLTEARNRRDAWMNHGNPSPGPWTARPLGTGEDHVIEDAAGNPIAMVLANQRANAHQMAASPELVDALRQCVSALQEWVEIQDQHDGRSGDEMALKAAQAALKKAGVAL